MKLNTVERKRFRIRKKLKDVSKDRYRLSVSRSAKNISAQIIDDAKNITLVSASSIDKGIKGQKKNKSELSTIVAEMLAKAKQVPDAIKKANELARRKLIQIPLRDGRTIHHDIYGKDGAGKIKLRSAPKGTGIIAGGPVRAVCEVLGIKDIVAKSLGTANPHNVIRACIKALSKQNSPKNISNLRNKKISEIIEKRG